MELLVFHANLSLEITYRRKLSENQPIHKEGRCVLLTLVPVDILAEESVQALAFFMQNNFLNQKNNFFFSIISPRLGKQY